jgi:hypothetical protein
MKTKTFQIQKYVFIDALVEPVSKQEFIELLNKGEAKVAISLDDLANTNYTYGLKEALSWNLVGDGSLNVEDYTILGIVDKSIMVFKIDIASFQDD